MRRTPRGLKPAAQVGYGCSRGLKPAAHVGYGYSRGLKAAAQVGYGCSRGLKPAAQLVAQPADNFRPNRSKRPPPVADAVLLLGRHLGCRQTVLGNQKMRVVPEPV